MRLTLLGLLALFFASPALGEIYNLPIGGGPVGVTPDGAVPGVGPGYYYRGAPDTGKGNNPVYDSRVPGMINCAQTAKNAAQTNNGVVPSVVINGFHGPKPQDAGIINDVATDNSQSYEGCLTGVLGANQPGVPEAPFN